MSTSAVTYPASPKNIDPRMLEPSPSFKREVTKVLGAILFFIFVYIALMGAAILLAVLSGWGGFLLVVAFPRFITLMIGLGLIGLGLLVIYFLLKFLFKRNKMDRSHLVEITAADQPELFQFIRTLTKETQSPFPKKVYLSPDVNACVFYDSSFWSMFLPVRKNLQIGLGLVNAVNLSEFKAILAHEFGHFSQRSMKIGSYVYNVNRVIYNMLYDNDGYSETLEGWGNLSGYFQFFAGVTLAIVRGIQFVLQKVYAIINLSYMSLSREMEFHADAVAASVSGSSHLVTSLRRLELAETCYSRLFEYYDASLKNNLKPDNLYPQHTEVMKQFAHDHDLPITNGLPQVNANSFAKFNQSRILIKDQWASHPSTDDREKHLNSLNVHAETSHLPAWAIFKDAEALQKQITEHVYREAKFNDTPMALDLSMFRSDFNTENEKFSLNKEYKGFFDGRSISPFDLTVEPCDKTSLQEILTDEACQLPYRIGGLNGDINTLTAIQDRSGGIKTFEFDGKKYTRNDAADLQKQLQDKLSATEGRLHAIEKELYNFFSKKAIAIGEGDKFRSTYEKMFAVGKESNEDMQKSIELHRLAWPIFHETMSIDRAKIIAVQLADNESQVKERLRLYLSDLQYNSSIKPDERTKLEKYVSSQHTYFSYSAFHDSELVLLTESIQLFHQIAYERNFVNLKELLNWQIQLNR